MRRVDRGGEVSRDLPAARPLRRRAHRSGPPAQVGVIRCLRAILGSDLSQSSTRIASFMFETSRPFWLRERPPR